MKRVLVVAVSGVILTAASACLSSPAFGLSQSLCLPISPTFCLLM